MAGGLLDQVVRDQAHVGLVDLVIDEMRAWLVDNEDLFESLITQRAPDVGADRRQRPRGPQDPHRGPKWLADIRRDPDHDVRRALEEPLSTWPPTSSTTR